MQRQTETPRLSLAASSVLVCLIAIWLAAGWYSVRAAWADSLYRQDTPDSLEKCVALDPGNASCHALLAEHLEGLARDPEPEFAEARRLDPFDSALLLRAAIRAEAAGNFAESERYLLKAAAVDRHFAPRWALMNYYFRRVQAEPFWLWAHRAMDMSYEDRTPLFRLMWNIAGESDRSVRQKIRLAPAELRGYLAFLTAEHPEAGGELAESLAAGGGDDDVPALLNYCDRILTSDPGTALMVWNSLCRRKLLPFEPLDPAHGNVLANEDFQGAVGQGFDWRLSGCEGIAAEPVVNPAALRIQFDGRDAENCVVASRVLPPGPASRYRIQYAYKIDDRTGAAEDAFAGLTWELGEESWPPEAPAEFSHGDGWKTGQVSFAAAHTGITRLNLRYRRLPGTVDAEGTVLLRGIRMTPIP